MQGVEFLVSDGLNAVMRAMLDLMMARAKRHSQLVAARDAPATIRTRGYVMHGRGCPTHEAGQGRNAVQVPFL